MILLILVIAFAIAGGVLGEFLQLAAWLVIALAAVGAVIAFFVYRTFDRVRGKIT